MHYAASIQVDGDAKPVCAAQLFHEEGIEMPDQDAARHSSNAFAGESA